MIRRILTDKIMANLYKGRIIIVYGARQVGKTTLLKQIEASLKTEVLWLNGDEPDVRSIFEDATSTQIKLIIGNKKTVFIDEAQRIKNIGLTLKLFADNFPDVQVVVTGSSSFELADNLKEPLTGRKIEYYLYPLSFQELVNHYGYLEAKRRLNFILKYGLYPEVIVSPENAKSILMGLTDSYLYKDLLIYEGIKKHSLLSKILQALALQIGSEVSFSEIGQLVGADKNTVEKYIDLLEKSFVIFRLNALSRNMRNEIKKGKKFYFWDIGIRNALIVNFNEANLRSDIGGIWENFIIGERIKFLKYNELYANVYFWRTVTQSEIDFIEEMNGVFNVYEIKWNFKKKRLPKMFKKTYPVENFEIIDKSNFEKILLLPI
ncbi:ATP-binding protein [Desulfothermus okinawensis JCM 13304]